jgi:hypothetical protein
MKLRIQLLRIVTLAFVVVALTGCGLTAPHDSDGYADLESLDLNEVDITMMFSLGPSLLRLAALAVDDQPELQALLREVEGVRVRIYEINGDALAVAEEMDQMSLKLRDQNWEPVVRVVEEGSRTHVLMKGTADRISGLTVLTSDGLEAVVVNVIGDLEPEFFAQTLAALDVTMPGLQSSP